MSIPPFSLQDTRGDLVSEKVLADSAPAFLVLLRGFS